VPSFSVLILLVLESNLGQVHDEVLDLGISLGALSTSQVVEPCHLVHEEVDNGADDNDTDGVAPDDNDSDDGSIMALEKDVLGRGIGLHVVILSQPAEDAEEGRENIDHEDGADEFPGWPGVATAGYENQPVFGE